MKNEMLRHFAVLAVIVFWSASIYMIRRWRGSKAITFSNHAASEKGAYYLFAIAVSLETILYAFFLYGWFIPKYSLPILFSILAALTLIGHLISGLVPETKGWARKIHYNVALGVVWLFIPTTWIIALSEKIPTAGRIAALLAVLTMVILWIILFTVKSSRKNSLIFQSLYIATLPVVLIICTYA